MIKELGFVRVGAIVPKIKVANPRFNSSEIINQIKEASKRGVDIVTTPELAITGYTCGDLIVQDALIQSALIGLKNIVDETKELDIISIIGTPLVKDNQLYDCVVVIQKGEILAVIPKYKGFIQNRWFDLGNISLFDKEVPFGVNILFENETDKKITFAIEIGEAPSSDIEQNFNHVRNVAMIIFNPTASEEIIGRYTYRKQLINMRSSNNICGYIYCSAGSNESSTDSVFSGHAMIAENGQLLKENERFDLDSNLIYCDIDIQKLRHDRLKKEHVNIQNNNEYIYVKFKDPKNIAVKELLLNNEDNTEDLDTENIVFNVVREYREYPFVPSNEDEKIERCKEIINIQSTALAKRLLHTGIKKTVIGLSGGQDSTLAFLVIIEAYKKLKIDNINLIAVTMPGFGTTGRTYENACKLAKTYGATLREISIKEACIGHMKDIGLEDDDRSITYENAQARERTQILMDVANKEGALVIGTGDLSELALGWCTYNGDHMSMYGVNASIPKTLVRELIKSVADKTEEQTLYDILDTPISPELLPPDKYGNLVQKTENTIGPYVLHDFFLYHFLRYGASPKKIYVLAKHAFKGKFKNEDIKKWLEVFLKRFFSQQFKRSCAPDGPKVGSVGLSPRDGFKMPSDADGSIWISELDDCK